MQALSFLKYISALLVFLAGLIFPKSILAQETPMDLILAVDVSYSMTVNKVNPVAADSEGKRWDGLQFLIDTAGDDDRIAIILFQQKAHLVTQQMDGEGGFVPVRGVGRKKLKELVSRLKEIEQKSQDNFKKDKSEIVRKYDGLPGKSGPFEIAMETDKDVGLLGGTSNYNALTLASTDLVPKMRREVDQRLLLFTDGADSDIKTLKELAKEEDPAKKKVAFAEREKYLINCKKLAKDIGNQKIPMIVFGLGNDCDDELLNLFALESRPTDKVVAQKIGYSEYHKVATNVELFEKLRQVGWELRQRWPIPLERGSIAGGASFTTPNLSPFSDFGVLLFAQKANSATKPDEVKLNDPTGTEELTSSSHTYLRLPSGKDTVAKIDVKAKTEIEQYAAAGTTKPLFTFRSPRLEEPYSPLDQVPLVVAFNPEAGKGFDASQFEVAVEIIKADGTNPFSPSPKASPGSPLRFDLTLTTDGSGLFQYLWIPHRTWRTDKPDYLSLKGRWDIRVFLTAKSGPLKGAKRALFLKQFELTDYPKLEIGSEKLEVSNLSKNPKPGLVQASVRFNPPLRNPPSGVLLPVSHTFASERNDLKFPLPKKVDLTASPSGELSVPILDLTLIDWAKLKAGDTASATFAYAVPWQAEPAKGTVTIKKERYSIDLVSNTIKFDAGDPVLKGAVVGSLETDLVTEELYFLSGEEKPEGQSLEVVLRHTNGKNNKIAKVKIKGGMSSLRGGPDRNQARLDVEVTLDNNEKTIADGDTFEGVIYLRGPSIKQREINIQIVREAVQIQVRTRGEEWLPVTKLRFPALAGTSVEKEFRFALRVNEKANLEVSGKFTPPPFELKSDEALERGGKLLSSAPESTTAKTRRLQLEVPSSVVEGIYANELKFKVQSEGKVFECSLPTEVQVMHRAIKAVDKDSKPLLKSDGGTASQVRIPFEEGGVNSILPLALVSDTLSPDHRIGWDCEILPAKGAKETEWLKQIKVTDALNGQTVLKSIGSKTGPPTTPLWRDAEKGIRPRREIRVEFPTKELAPGLYSFVLKVNSRLEVVGKGEPKDGPPPKADDPTVAPSAPYEIPFEILVPGREIISVKTELKELALGSKTSTEIKIKCYGLTSGIGALTAIDDPKQPEISLKEAEKKVISTDETDYTFKGDYAPQRGGVSRLQLNWPKTDIKLPAVQVLSKETQIDVGGVLLVEPTMALPGETIKVKLSLTAETVKSMGGQVLLQARRVGSNDPPIDVLLQDDGKPDSGDEKAGDGEYTGKLRCPGGKGDTAVMGKYVIDWPVSAPQNLPLRSTTSNDPSAKAVKPPMFYIGLERGGEEKLGLINYDTGFFGWLPSVQTTITKEGVFTLKNYGPTNCRYKITILHPSTVTVSRNILNADPVALDQTKSLVAYDPKLHIHLNPFIGGASSSDTPVIEGELSRDDELKIALTAMLSEEANDAWRNKKPHESLGTVNGAIIKVELTWDTPEGEKWSRVVYQRVQISTESFWETQGLAYGLSFFGILLIFGLGLFWYIRRRRRKKKLALNAPSSPIYDDPLLSGGHKQTNPQGGSSAPSSPPPTTSNYDDIF